MESLAYLSRRVLSGACDGVLTGVGRGQISQGICIGCHQKKGYSMIWVTSGFCLR